MKIGIVGSGPVAQVLGTGYVGKGHEVMLGTRNAAKLGEWLSGEGERASVGTFAQAAEFGEIVFLSVNAAALESAISLAGTGNFTGKTVIDLSNPMDFSDGIPPRFTATVGDSLGERVQRMLPEANIVKAYNSIGVAVMTDPIFDGEAATHFIAGDDAAAKVEAAGLIREFGWEVEDVGGIDQSFFLELSRHFGSTMPLKTGHWTQAFKLLKR